jgi:23S rRNA pseudouridine2457 synthase
MTANVGFPTLRLVRIAVGEWTIEGLQPGQYREMSVPMTIRRMKPNPPQRKP